MKNKLLILTTAIAIIGSDIFSLNNKKEEIDRVGYVLVQKLQTYSGSSVKSKKSFILKKGERFKVLLSPTYTISKWGSFRAKRANGKYVPLKNVLLKISSSAGISYLPITSIKYKNQAIIFKNYGKGLGIALFEKTNLYNKPFFESQIKQVLKQRSLVKIKGITNFNLVKRKYRRKGKFSNNRKSASKTTSTWYYVELNRQSGFIQSQNMKIDNYQRLIDYKKINYSPLKGYARILNDTPKVYYSILRDKKLKGKNICNNRYDKNIFYKNDYATVRGVQIIDNIKYYNIYPINVENLLAKNKIKKAKNYSYKSKTMECYLVSQRDVSVFYDAFTYTKKYLKKNIPNKLLIEVNRLVGKNLIADKMKVQDLSYKNTKDIRYLLVTASNMNGHKGKYIIIEEDGYYKSLAKFNSFYGRRIDTRDFNGDGKLEIISNYSETRGSAGAIEVYNYTNNEFVRVFSMKKSYSFYNIYVKKSFIAIEMFKYNKGSKNTKEYRRYLKRIKKKFNAATLGEYFDKKYDGNEVRYLKLIKGIFTEVAPSKRYKNVISTKLRGI